jgi:transposase
LAKVLESEPHTFGYPFTLWTAKRLAAHMAKETGIQLSISRLRSVLRERGYVYRRPKHDLKSLQDPLARTAAEQWLTELKKEPWPGSSSSSLWMRPP